VHCKARRNGYSISENKTCQWPNCNNCKRGFVRRHFVTSGGRVHVIGGLVKDNKIKVVAGYYDVTNGVVALLD